MVSFVEMFLNVLYLFFGYFNFGVCYFNFGFLGYLLGINCNLVVGGKLNCVLDDVKYDLDKVIVIGINWNVIGYY